MKLQLLWAGAVAALLVVLMIAYDGSREMELEVRAEVVETGAPVSVSVWSIGADTDGLDGLLFHEVLVRWEGDEARRLDDARFTHHVADNQGDLVTAGRHCRAQWDDVRSVVMHPCLRDFLNVILAPGETHAYPVHVYPEIGPLRLTKGRYVLEEVIHWWSVDAQPSPSEGSFTIRLTYEVH